MYKFISCSIFTLLAALGIIGCKNGTPKDMSQDTGHDSIVLQSNRPIYDRLLEELDSTEIYDDSILYGYWFKPHEASAVNIFFHKDGTFEFKYYIVQNDTTIIDVVKKGTFTIGDADASNTRVIKMNADDGWDDKVFKGEVQYKRNDTNFYLSDEESGLYLVKGSD